jgi:tRNA(Ile)-lysidine synthase
MGSSPVTATNAAAATAAAQELRETLRRFFSSEAPAAGAPLLVAFSGGIDSCALLWGLHGLAGELGCTLVAGHFDHRLDPGSGARALHARRLASQLRIGWCEGAAEPGAFPRGQSREAAARHLRYAFLDQQRHAFGARWVVTAHHRDDQVETVLLRLSLGSGPAGLAGMAARSGAVVRPLLPLGRALLAAAVAGSPMRPTEDPTNRDPRAPRNRLRHGVIPRLPTATLELSLRLAEAAGAARRRIERHLETTLLGSVPADPGPSLAALRALPSPLLPWATALLHRRAGLPYPPRLRATAELSRQLQRPEPPRCDCGDGWQWVGLGEHLVLRPKAEPPRPFAYTLGVPGAVAVEPVGCLVRLSRQPVAPWMWRGSSRRAALNLPLEPGQTVTVRSRRPGDRLQPLGCRHRRKLKEVLIDRKVAPEQRDRLPLLCFGDQVAWVPGVTIHDPFRLPSDARSAWVVELVGADEEPEGP